MKGDANIIRAASYAKRVCISVDITIGGIRILWAPTLAATPSPIRVGSQGRMGGHDGCSGQAGHAGHAGHAVEVGYGRNGWWYHSWHACLVSVHRTDGCGMLVYHCNGQ